MKTNLRIFLLVAGTLFMLFLIVSCQPENKDDSIGNEGDGELITDEVKETDPDHIDSSFLIKLEKSFIDKTFLTNYADSVLGDENYYMDNSFVEAKLDINGDGIEDYLVLGNSFHHAWGSFFDGENGSELNVAPSFVNGIFWNRPFPNETTEGVLVSIIDANCNDHQKDLQVIYQSGSVPGSVNHGAYLEIYHYNSDSDYIDIIFNEQISHMWDEDNLDTIWEFNYEFSHIDQLYMKRECCEEIIITEGVGPSNDDVFNYMKIQRKEGGWTKTFVYDQELQKYLKE